MAIHLLIGYYCGISVLPPLAMGRQI